MSKMDVAEGIRLAPSARIEHALVKVLDVTINNMTVEAALALLAHAARDAQKTTCFFANANTIELARRSPSFRRVLQNCDFTLGDGTGVRWAARMLGCPLLANLNGTDLIPAFLAAESSKGLRIFLLGATPEVVERSAAAVRRKFPNVVLVGSHHGFLDERSTVSVIEAINKAETDVLLVGMGHPTQETWITEHRAKLSTQLVLAVGGLLSYLSGDYVRAPKIMRRFGVEWLAILFTQRQKWRRYVIGAPIFLACVLFELVFGRLARRT